MASNLIASQVTLRMPQSGFNEAKKKLLTARLSVFNRSAIRLRLAKTVVGDRVACKIPSFHTADPDSFLFLVARSGAPNVASLLLVAMPFVTSSFFVSQ